MKKSITESLAKKIALVGMMTAMLSTGKVVLSFIPNVEIVSFMIVMFSVYFGRKTLLAVSGFVIIEGLLYGFNIWWVGYVYTWPLLCIISYYVRKRANLFTLTVISTLFGLFFGFMFSFVYIFAGSPNPGIGFALTWWAAGIPYDLIHGTGNAAVMLCLFKPVSKVLSIVTKNTRGGI